MIESLIDQQLAVHSGGHVFFSTAAANLEWQSIEIFLWNGQIFDGTRYT